MATIYVVRHAQAEGNLYRRTQGWYDSRVTALGEKQIQALSKRFRGVKIDAVYSSDLLRARTTALAVTVPRHMEVIPDPGLREIHLGEYEDMPFGELDALHTERWQHFRERLPQWHAPGGETYQQVCDRVTKSFFRIAQDHPDETVAVFSHGLAILCLQASLKGKTTQELAKDPLCGNTGVSCYEVKDGKFRILYENDATHLPPELVSRPSKVPNAWFQPMDLETGSELYRQARMDGWLAVHTDLMNFDGPGFWAEAKDQAIWDPRSLQTVLIGHEPVGVLQLSTLKGVRAGVGYIPFLWLGEAWRRQGVGGQLIGQAASVYRSMGRKKLRLQCSPLNGPAQCFYRKYGFVKKGTVPGAEGELDLLEKDI